MKNKKELLENAHRICIFRTDRIGDMILTLPMVNALLQVNPTVEIHFIISKYTEPLLKNQPLIKSYYFIEEIIDENSFLISKEFDVAFFPRPKFDEVFSAFRARIPLRIGSAYRVYSFLLNHRVKEHRKFGKKSEAEHNLNLISSITKQDYEIQLIPPVVDRTIQKNIKEKFNLPENFIIIHPGGGGSAPKLPLDKFIEISKMISSKYSRQIVVTGNKAETQLAEAICQSTNSYNLSDKLSLTELIALIDLSDGVIANSTGIVHLAASLEKKILAFYPNSPQMNSIRWGPISTKKIILTPEYTQKQDRDKMDLISLENIEAAFCKLFLTPDNSYSD